MREAQATLRQFVAEDTRRQSVQRELDKLDIQTKIAELEGQLGQAKAVREGLEASLTLATGKVDRSTQIELLSVKAQERALTTQLELYQRKLKLTDALGSDPEPANTRARPAYC